MPEALIRDFQHSAIPLGKKRVGACSPAVRQGNLAACQEQWRAPAGGVVMCALIAGSCFACRGIMTGGEWCVRVAGAC